MSNIHIFSQCQSGQAQLVLINVSEAPVTIDGVYLNSEDSPSCCLLTDSMIRIDPGQERFIDVTSELVPMFGYGTSVVQDKKVEVRLDLGKNKPSLNSQHHATLQSGAITHFSPMIGPCARLWGERIQTNRVVTYELPKTATNP